MVYRLLRFENNFNLYNMILHTIKYMDQDFFYNDGDNSLKQLFLNTIIYSLYTLNGITTSILIP